MRFCFIVTGMLLLWNSLTASAQLTPKTEAVWPEKVQPRTADTPLEFFCGMDLHYADVNFTRLYNTLVNLTPGIKWNMGNDWQLATQAWFPLDNQGYYTRYDMVRLATLALSKELHFTNARQHLKFTAGLFGRERWGADVKWMMPVNDWLMLQAQGGLTRHWALAFGWDGEYEMDFTDKGNGPTRSWIPSGTLGARTYLRPWDTEFVLNGGRYINKDFGAQLEILRHFKHCTVSIYGQLHKRGSNMYSNHRSSGGFKILVMLDRKGWRFKTNHVTFRPASVFRLTYSAQTDNESMRTYTTDPEENERILPMRIY
jgi:hypothetical protein